MGGIPDEAVKSRARSPSERERDEFHWLIKGSIDIERIQVNTPFLCTRGGEEYGR